MKKISLLVVLFAFAFASISFAEGVALTNDTPSPEGVQIYGGVDAADAAAVSAVLLGKMSKGVKFNAFVCDQSTAVGYALATKHTSGTKIYGTAHDSTAIYFKDVGTVALDATNLGVCSNTAFSTGGWTTM